MESYEKLDKLKDILKNYGSAAVAFSGGVDSTFLLKVACDVLGEKAVGITVRSAISSTVEMEETQLYAQKLGARHITLELDVFSIKGFSGNPPDRCYICKKQVFSKIREEAAKLGINNILDGSNVDDLDDYRPGKKALEELGIRSPLREAGMTKEDIRALSREMKLPTWDKPAFACLASRVPYGQEITHEKLEMVEKAEQLLASLGFRQFRVRHHGDIARVEVSAEERKKFFNEEMMDRVHDELRKIGFQYAALDFRGYRTGSLNEALKTSQ